ncbi:MAG: hypothetical protein NVV59_09280 [Chitinophagaceae bacterium]|nr:hypothetical protein [Chitinophagaceae bacterium]
MGDSGSLMIGLVNSILVIKFINVASDASVVVPIQSAAAVGISILIVPLFDTLRVFAIRIFNGRSPFTPDRNHIHHMLLSKGLGHAAVTLICVSANITFVALAYAGRSLGSTYLLLLMCAIGFAAIGLLYYSSQRRKQLVVTRRSMKGELTGSKIDFQGCYPYAGSIHSGSQLRFIQLI